MRSKYSIIADRVNRTRIAIGRFFMRLFKRFHLPAWFLAGILAIVPTAAFAHGGGGGGGGHGGGFGGGGGHFGGGGGHFAGGGGRFGGFGGRSFGRAIALRNTEEGISSTEIISARRSFPARSRFLFWRSLPV